MVCYLSSGRCLGMQKIARIMARELKIRYVDVRDIVDETVEQMIFHLCRGHRVVFKGFGTFSTVKKRPRQVRNPYTNEHMDWNGGLRAKFKVSSDWQATCNGTPTQGEGLKAKRYVNPLKDGDIEEDLVREFGRVGKYKRRYYLLAGSALRQAGKSGKHKFISREIE